MPPRPARPRRAPGRARRALIAVAAGVVLGLVVASPAAADPPAPTNYRSEVLSVDPDVEGLAVEVVGGDGFLQVEVDRGRTLEVPGYSGEPYLRVQPDGTVQENQQSAATYLNQSRDRTDLDRSYSADAEPEWRTVATDGRWAWHDHRIHYMGRGEPAAARTAQGVEWEVPMSLDGDDVLVAGRYRLLDAPSPLPWLLAAVVAGGVVVGLSRVLAPVTATGAALLLVGVGGVVVGMAQRGASPPGAPTSTLVVILPALAVVAGVVVVMQRGRVLRAVAALAGVAALGGWGLVRVSVLWNAELPTSLAAPVDRLVTAAALGVVAAGAVLVVRSGALAPPPPEPHTPPAGAVDPSDPAPAS